MTNKRVALVPHESDLAMLDAGQTAIMTCVQDGHATSFHCGWTEAMAAAPNGGKVSRKQLNRAKRAALADHWHRLSDEQAAEVARAVIIAFGLEIEE